MNFLNDILGKHPIWTLQKSIRRNQILDSFRAWVKEDEFIDWHLSLYRFASIRPLKYWDPRSIDTALAFFQQYPKETLEAIIEQHGLLSHSVFSMVREGSSWGKENRLGFGEPKDLLDFEKVWHPEYQRYSEHVFNHLIRVPLGVLGKIKGKNYQTPPLGNRVETLRNNSLELLTKGFNRIVRNAISHGSITFDIFGMRYLDDKSSEFLMASDFSRLFDDLVDTCHSILVGILLFLCRRHAEVESIGLDIIPLGIRFLLIDSLSSHSGFGMLSMIENIMIDNRKQLNIACKIDTLSRRMQMFESLNVAWRCINLGIGDYGRLAITLDCGKKVPATLFLNADRLRQAIIKNEPAESSLREILETSLLWFDSSYFYRRIYIWKSVISTTWQKFKQEHSKELRKRGLKSLSSAYFIRHIENKSTENIRRIEGHVVLKERGEIKEDFINRIIKHLVRNLKKHKVKLVNLGEERLIKRSPRYIWIRLYVNDKRLRSLITENWDEKNLVLQAEWFSRWKNNGPIAVKKPQRMLGRIRVEYNPVLLKDAEETESPVKSSGVRP